MSDLSFSIGPLRFPNPVVLASGTAGYGYELEPYIDLDLLGGVITKGIYPAPRAGNPSPLKLPSKTRISSFNLSISR